VRAAISKTDRHSPNRGSTRNESVITLRENPDVEHRRRGIVQELSVRGELIHAAHKPALPSTQERRMSPFYFPRLRSCIPTATRI